MYSYAWEAKLTASCLTAFMERKTLASGRAEEVVAGRLGGMVCAIVVVTVTTSWMFLGAATQLLPLLLLPFAATDDWAGRFKDRRLEVEPVEMDAETAELVGWNLEDAEAVSFGGPPAALLLLFVWKVEDGGLMSRLGSCRSIPTIPLPFSKRTCQRRILKFKFSWNKFEWNCGHIRVEFHKEFFKRRAWSSLQY